jgi:CRP/FNR family transcriptional regulator, anaerobic regulatory protein
MDIELKNINPKFIELFRQTFGFTEEEFASFLSCFTVKTIPKKDYYLRPGECCHSKAYLNKGCTRNFVVDEQGHERILLFAFEDWWLGDFESYYSGTPATTYIQMLEDSEVLIISKESFLKSEQEIPKLKQWYTYKMPRSASASMNRIVEEDAYSRGALYKVTRKAAPHFSAYPPAVYCLLSQH